jgi:hypothetical protein
MPWAGSKDEVFVFIAKAYFDTLQKQGWDTFKKIFFLTIVWHTT